MANPAEPQHNNDIAGKKNHVDACSSWVGKPAQNCQDSSFSPEIGDGQILSDFIRYSTWIPST